jgi:hypothetical protein
MHANRTKVHLFTFLGYMQPFPYHKVKVEEYFVAHDMALSAIVSQLISHFQEPFLLSLV